MKIEPFVSGMETHFVVKSESVTDRAMLTQFCRSSRWQTHEFRISGTTWQDGATTDFSFGWVDKREITKLRALLRKLRSGLLPGLFR